LTINKLTYKLFTELVLSVKNVINTEKLNSVASTIRHRK